MIRNKIKLDTFNDVQEFVNIVSCLEGKILLRNDDYCGNAKSLLSVMSTIEWDKIYCDSEKDIYKYIKKFCS